MQNNNNSKISKTRGTNSSKKSVTKAPVARGVAARSQPPRMSSNGLSVQIRHREFVGSVSNAAVTGFALTPISLQTPGYDINPGSSLLFPWLSTIAVSFERYRFSKLIFHFIPSQPTTTAGRFYAAVDYDYDDSVAASKAQLMGNSSSVECPVWMEVSLPVIAAQLHRDMPTKYVNLQTRSNFVEPRTAFGGFLMCAFDTPTANLTYDCWAEYTVELLLPVVESTIVVDAPVSGVYSATAAVANLGPGAVKWNFPSIAQPQGCPIKLVTPGAGGNPILDCATVVGAAAYAPAALDLGTGNRAGKLDLYTEASVTGTTPSTLLGTNAIGQTLAIFNSLGTYLGFLTGDLSATGPKLPAEVGTASAVVRALQSYFIRSIVAAYPTARYLVPLLGSTGALGAGFLGAGLKYEL